ncbi:hypothetical protein GCM10022381_04480 [Leifsonia kafniensis]|uniref:DUF732 domain-containing protein n=1 Tax=Leifsonia kafniensis TaxID=475957 RepID=A0ABP7K2F1_9MICO
MSTVKETSTRRGRSITYIISVVLLIVLATIGLFTFRSANETARAAEKADQLIANIEATGATAPSRDQIIRVLGDDGGAVCANPNDALSQALFLSQLVNGSGGPGTRPVIAESRAVQGQLMIIQVYCPEELAQFQEFVNGLQTTDSGGQ